MRYIATGRVHPERADISFSRIDLSIGSAGRMAILCDSSQLSVVLDSNEFDGWISAHIAAEHLASMVVSALGFALGSGYSVELIQLIEEDGTPHVFGVRPGTLEFDPSNQTLDRALRLAAENIYFRLALRDYVRAITDVSDCASYCFRAIESVKNAFPSGGEIGAWAEMHAALGTDRTDIDQRVKRFADPVRHGNWAKAPVTTGATRLDILLCTKDVLSRFLDYARPPPNPSVNTDVPGTSDLVANRCGGAPVTLYR